MKILLNIVPFNSLLERMRERSISRLHSMSKTALPFQNSKLKKDIPSLIMDESLCCAFLQCLITFVPFVTSEYLNSNNFFLCRHPKVNTMNANKNRNGFTDKWNFLHLLWTDHFCPMCNLALFSLYALQMRRGKKWMNFGFELNLQTKPFFFSGS